MIIIIIMINISSLLISIVIMIIITRLCYFQMATEKPPIRSPRDSFADRTDQKVTCRSQCLQHRHSPPDSRSEHREIQVLASKTFPNFKG